MNYLKNPNICNNSIINNENYKKYINQKISNRNNLSEKCQLNPNNAFENNNLSRNDFFRKNKSCVNLSSRNLNDSNFKIKESDFNSNKRKIKFKNRNISYINQTLYNDKNKRYIINKDKENKKEGLCSTYYTNFPLIKK